MIFGPHTAFPKDYSGCHHKNQRSKYAKHLKTNFLAILGRIYYFPSILTQYDCSLITSFYFVIIYREYHQNDLNAITSRLRGHLPIFGNRNLDVHLGGKGSQMGKMFMNFIFASKFTYTIIFMPLEHF